MANTPLGADYSKELSACIHHIRDFWTLMNSHSFHLESGVIYTSRQTGSIS